MGYIKSAREIADEKIASLGEVTEEERLNWKYYPEGEKIAATYTRGDCNLTAELSRYDEKVKSYVISGVQAVLIRNIDLPKNDHIKQLNKRAMDGFKTLKGDKAAVENVFSQIRRLFEHYSSQGDQQRKQAYETLKSDFTAKVQQALQQQMGNSIPVNMANINVENQPQFQEEWQKLKNQMDDQYLSYLDEYKQELLNIP